MTIAYVGIGSNLDPEVHVPAGVEALRTEFSGVVCSPVYRTEPVGFEGPPFLNLVARLETERSLEGVLERLRAVEARFGRERPEPGEGPKEKSFSSRTLDLDLLLYGDRVTREPVELPRRDVAEYPFVAKPLADLDAQGRIPGEERTFGALWASFPAEAEAGMRRVELDLPC
ncbi:2-amino-4-hydroxy-6-hydroxymethyldihydropteridine diphosphokinase [Thiohalorhabdus methylotrophus]|uniref:2-amino-4-hydroxy-6-hydroxymethyldihydropteridine pyrophosphokinase n=1 Tax=Thiohalorhabdus methylotrophus TaxID=3242694 RepID=A0ABV4TR53_9GAMM